MALRGTLTHRKTRRLANALDIPVPCALGILEALWHLTAAQAPAGNIGRLSDQDIADEILWPNDAAVLVAALVAVGYLDLHDAHRVVVHDWEQHCDQSVRRRLVRRDMTFASREQLAMASQRLVVASDQLGTASLPVPEPVPEPEPEPVQHLDSDQSESGQCPQNGKTPSPPPKRNPEFASFDTFWAAYPRKVAKGDARKAWEKMRPNVETLAAMLRSLTWQCDQPDWQKDDGTFIPYPASWLNGLRWEDERPELADIDLPPQFDWAPAHCDRGCVHEFKKTYLAEYLTPAERRCPSLEKATA